MDQHENLKDMKPPATQSEKIVPGKNTGEQSILIVDESPVVRHLLRDRLQQQGYIVLESLNGGEAIELVKKSKPSLILMDTGLHAMDGLSTCAYLKKQKKFQHIPILLITLQEDEAFVDKAFEAGADDYLIKPIQWSCLRQRILYQLNQQYLKKKLEDQARALRLAKAEAESANLAKSEFLANMSHELRTPMHGILSYAQFGLKRIDKVPREKLKEYFQEINDSGDKLLKLLNEIIDLAKLETGKMSYDFHEENIVEEVDSVLYEFAGLAKDKHVSFSINLPEIPAVVNFDRLRIGQVLRNLLANAIGFTESDSTIGVSAENEISDSERLSHKNIKISISYKGNGIPEEELVSVFDKFVQSSVNQWHSGHTGLGLAICRQIIEDHHGKITVQQNSDGVLTFSVSLPLVQDPAI